MSLSHFISLFLTFRTFSLFHFCTFSLFHFFRAGNGPPALPQSPAYSQSEWPRKRCFAASGAQGLNSERVLPREKRRRRPGNTSGRAGICMRNAAPPQWGGTSRKSMQKPPISNPPLAVGLSVGHRLQRLQSASRINKLCFVQASHRIPFSRFTASLGSHANDPLAFSLWGWLLAALAPAPKGKRSGVVCVFANGRR